MVYTPSRPRDLSLFQWNITSAPKFFLSNTDSDILTRPQRRRRPKKQKPQKLLQRKPKSRPLRRGRLRNKLPKKRSSLMPRNRRRTKRAKRGLKSLSLNRSPSPSHLLILTPPRKRLSSKTSRPSLDSGVRLRKRARVLRLPKRRRSRLRVETRLRLTNQSFQKLLPPRTRQHLSNHPQHR